MIHQITLTEEEVMDVSIVNETHRQGIQRNLMGVFTRGRDVLTKEARLQIMREELDKFELKQLKSPQPAPNSPINEDEEEDEFD
jgi:hypothetical protein